MNPIGIWGEKDDTPHECQECGAVTCCNDLYAAASVFHCLDKNVQSVVLSVIAAMIVKNETKPMKVSTIENDTTGSKIGIISYIFCKDCWFDFITATCLSIMAPDKLDEYGEDGGEKYGEDTRLEDDDD